MIEYTIGEIFRNKLLINSKGEPYKDKASVSNVLKGFEPFCKRPTPNGMAKFYTAKQIKVINKRWD